MEVTFYKYHGTGNDFIIIDNRFELINKADNKRIAQICHRQFGVGADGFILLENDANADFRMIYYNADGNQSSMCGNGGRCIVAFAKHLGIINESVKFNAIDGLHHAYITENVVRLQMQNVEKLEPYNTHTFLDTGSPHHVTMVKNLDNFNVKSEGEKIRYGDPYNNAGSNVNFVEQISDNSFFIRTYERGVEDETFSCGTGVTAVALAMHYNNKTNSNEVEIKTPGGHLKVTFEVAEIGYKNIWLIGKTKQVFKGKIEW